MYLIKKRESEFSGQVRITVVVVVVALDGKREREVNEND